MTGAKANGKRVVSAKCECGFPDNPPAPTGKSAACIGCNKLYGEVDVSVDSGFRCVGLVAEDAGLWAGATLTIAGDRVTNVDKSGAQPRDIAEADVRARVGRILGESERW